MSTSLLTIGVDGGATKVSSWHVRFKREDHTFFLGQIHCEKAYSEIPGYIPDFKPVAIAEQLDQFQNGSISPTAAEKQQAACYVEACAQSIEAIAADFEDRKLLIGLGMPGLKTEDKRGIAVVANGPRMINYCSMLESRLRSAGLELEASIHHLGSDADYCGIGENYAVEGMFRNADTAYYLGGGTGVADAMKIDGELHPFDMMKSWNPKTWELKGEDGRSLERYISAGGIQSLYAEIAGEAVSELNRQKIYPPQIAEMAAAGDDAAAKTYKMVSGHLANLLYARIVTLHSGWNGAFEFVNPNRAALEKEHPYHGKKLQRIIIGQRLGQVMASVAGQKVLTQPVVQSLNKQLSESSELDKDTIREYATTGDLIVFSKLREAPALGAGIDAFFSWQDYQ